MDAAEWDAIIVGAGPAGCTVAALLARAGHRTLLLDRQPIPHARLCTHAIMPSGLPVLAELGILGDIEAAGAQPWWGVRLSLNGETIAAPLPAGWTTHDHGLSLRRTLLDPLLLAAVAREPDATIRAGWQAEALLGHDGVIQGVRARDPQGHVQRLTARLVVAADGRRSRLVRAARLPARRAPNRHVALIAYLSGVPPEPRPYLEAFYDHGRSASLLPADDGLRVAGVMAPPDRWPRAEWGDRLLAELRRYPGMAERLRDARLASAPLPVRGLRNVIRASARPGFALVGDAAAQTDPAFGQGIAWALCSGARLARAADAALHTSAGPVTLPLNVARAPLFLPLFWGTSALSAVPPGSLVERLLVAAAAAAPHTTALALRAVLGFAARPRAGVSLPTVHAWTRQAVMRR